MYLRMNRNYMIRGACFIADRCRSSVLHVSMLCTNLSMYLFIYLYVFVLHYVGTQFKFSFKQNINKNGNRIEA